MAVREVTPSREDIYVWTRRGQSLAGIVPVGSANIQSPVDRSAAIYGFVAACSVVIAYRPTLFVSSVCSIRIQTFPIHPFSIFTSNYLQNILDKLFFFFINISNNFFFNFIIFVPFKRMKDKKDIYICSVYFLFCSIQLHVQYVCI